LFLQNIVTQLLDFVLGRKVFLNTAGSYLEILVARVEQGEPTAGFGAIDRRWELAVLSNRTGIELVLKTK
jgi:hypothetical protein